MKDRTSIRRGNSYRFPMDNNPSFSLSLFLPINREGSGHENASAGIEQNVRTSEDERENAPRGTRFMSAYSCRLDVGHEIHHYTEQRAFTSRSNGTVRDSLVNRLQQGMAFRV